MRITQNIHQLKHNFKIKLADGKEIDRFVNTLIIFDEFITLIDTGTRQSLKKIKSYIESYGKSIEDIKNIILTHGHPDHIGSAYEIKKLSNCKVFAHNKEKEWIENIDLQLSNRPVPGFYDLVNKSVKIDYTLYGNEKINLGEVDIYIINSPGHSPGSINILFKNEDIIFTGDSIPVINDIPNYYNYKDLRHSLKLIIENIPYKVLLSSWNEAIYTEKKQRDFLEEGIKYLDYLNDTVTKVYNKESLNNIDNCKDVINILKLPHFMINPIVHKAFISHF